MTNYVVYPVRTPQSAMNALNSFLIFPPPNDCTHGPDALGLLERARPFSSSSNYAEVHLRCTSHTRESTGSSEVSVFSVYEQNGRALFILTYPFLFLNQDHL